jgi:hypothetical protein
MPPKTATLAELQRTREIVALSPAGHTYKIRPLNIERHALAGHLPAALRALAMKGEAAKAIDGVLEGPEAELLEHGDEMNAYLDGLVRQVLVEPDVSELEDLDSRAAAGRLSVARAGGSRRGRSRRRGPAIVGPRASDYLEHLSSRA